MTVPQKLLPIAGNPLCWWVASKRGSAKMCWVGLWPIIRERRKRRSHIKIVFSKFYPRSSTTGWSRTDQLKCN